MQVGERPKLLSDCPESMTNLITDCWFFEPLERPTFQDICWRLCQRRQELYLNALNNMNNDVKVDKSNIPETQETSENILPTIDTMEHKGDTSAKKGGNELVEMQERILRAIKAS